MSGGLYRLEAFGLRSEWNLWRIARDALDEPEIESASHRRRLYVDDFGDQESLAIAMRLFPAIRDDLLAGRRSDRNVRLT